MKIGKPFNWEEEFTSSTDAPVQGSSRLLGTLTRKGITTPPGGALKASQFKAPEVRGYMEGVEEKVVLVDLNEDQKRMVREIIGWAPSKLEISISAGVGTRDVPLTGEQQTAINEALGIQMAAVSVARDPIEVTLK